VFVSAMYMIPTRIQIHRLIRPYAMTRGPSPGQRHDLDLLPFQFQGLAVTLSPSPALGHDSESESEFESVIPFPSLSFFPFFFLRPRPAIFASSCARMHWL
jgi:hypothetical protein